ncbi:thioredoxin family protein [Haloplanus sp. C73]|uniref:thioredoxin family protein n=1 Tax=Haloplanus sp. C73 TaxID=3421641 RepID=UPI003EBA9700
MAGPSTAALEDALDSLVDAGLVVERDDGSLVTTDDFESARRVYRDSYADIDDDAFRTTVADAFGVDESTAAARIDSGAVTREDLIAYLSLRSTLDDVDDERLATMATLVAELAPGSPVPESLTELDDESWPEFVEGDAVVTVWRHDCAPCDALKDDLDAVLSGLPADVAVAGIDGESAPEFRRAFDVDSAPAVCCFEDGELEAVVTGRHSPDTYHDRFEELY